MIRIPQLQIKWKHLGQATIVIPLFFITMSGCGSSVTVEEDTNNSKDGKATTKQTPVVNADGKSSGAHSNANNAANSTNKPKLVPIQEINRQWANVLSACVSPQDGAIRLKNLSSQTSNLNAILKAVAAKRTFDNDKQHLAFLINSYNIFVISQLAEYPFARNVRQIEGFYNRRTFKLLGEKRTLNVIRDGLVRNSGDPRGLIALFSGSIGSPPISIRPYDGKSLDNQLDAQCTRFVNSAIHNTALSGTLLLSKLLKWFEKDFDGLPFNGIVGFLKHYAKSGSRLESYLKDEGRPNVTFIEFNWSVNTR